MKNLIKKEIEKIFLSANSNDVLFDTFRLALQHQISDPEIYRALLANPTLKKEEITLFTDTYCKEFPENAYDIYLWAASIIESKEIPTETCEKAFTYYLKAVNYKPESPTPYIGMLNLFNYDFNLETNKKIIESVDKGLKEVDNKRPVYLKLAEHFKNLGNEQKREKCIRLANKNTNTHNQL